MLESENYKLLQELSEEDLHEYYYWKHVEQGQEAKRWNDPYIEEKDYKFDEFENNYLKKKYLYKNVLSTLAIKYKDEFLGVVTAYWEDKKSRWIECGIVIYKSNEWEKGLGYRIFKEWIYYLFQETNANRIGISTWSGNIRMVKVAKKVGMIEEGRIRQGRFVRGSFYDAIRMGILREEWNNL